MVSFTFWNMFPDSVDSFVSMSLKASFETELSLILLRAEPIDSTFAPKSVFMPFNELFVSSNCDAKVRLSSLISSSCFFFSSASFSSSASIFFAHFFSASSMELVDTFFKSSTVDSKVSIFLFADVFTEATSSSSCVFNRFTLSSCASKSLLRAVLSSSKILVVRCVSSSICFLLFSNISSEFFAHFFNFSSVLFDNASSCAFNLVSCSPFCFSTFLMVSSIDFTCSST